MLESFSGDVISPQSMQFFADSEADGADVSGIIVHQLHIFDPLSLLYVIRHEYQQTRIFSVGIEGIPYGGWKRSVTFRHCLN